MPRDNDKNNESSRGRRDRPTGGKGRSGAARGPEKKFAKRGFAGKSDGDKRLCAEADGENALCRQVRRRQILWQETVFGSGQALRRQA